MRPTLAAPLRSAVASARAGPSAPLAPLARRSLHASASRAFAQPTDEASAPAAGKAPQVKEFKIYRWVSRGVKSLQMADRGKGQGQKGEGRGHEQSADAPGLGVSLRKSEQRGREK